jgi:hypothetical protein
VQCALLYDLIDRIKVEITVGSATFGRSCFIKILFDLSIINVNLDMLRNSLSQKSVGAKKHLSNKMNVFTVCNEKVDRFRSSEFTYRNIFCAMFLPHINIHTTCNKILIQNMPKSKFCLLLMAIIKA